MRYRITIEEEDETTNAPAFRWHNRTVIELETVYLLREGITEWVKDELDEHATITEEDRNGQ